MRKKGVRENTTFEVFTKVLLQNSYTQKLRRGTIGYGYTDVLTYLMA